MLRCTDQWQYTNADMALPEAAYFKLAPELRICRILNGMWQVSGAHGPIDSNAAVANMFDYVDDGLVTWGLADHYGPAEDFVGLFRQRFIAERGPEAANAIRAFTKWVPEPGPMPRLTVEEGVARSLRRMDTDTLDLLQFHWWEYEDARYLDALDHLASLSNEGRIRYLGLTNFDTEHVRRILDHGIPLVSNQVQYSLIDRRPEVRMAALCQEANVGLLAYGTVCGGLLSERYLGKPEPRGAALDTASLQKYSRMVEAWGSWELFQELLSTLKRIGDEHEASIANVAVRFILDRPAVAGVIVGTRLGFSDRRSDTVRVFDLTLNEDDRDRIEAVLAKSRDLYELIGDCGDEYRR